jgi:hypothetical protein
MFQFPDLEKLFKDLIGCGIAIAIFALIAGLGLGWLIFGR